MIATLSFFVYFGVVVIVALIVWVVLRIMRGPRRIKYTRWEDFK